MTTTMMTGRLRILPGVALVAFSVVAFARAAPPAVFPAVAAWDPRPLSETDGFYESYLVPRMSARFSGGNELTVADFVNPQSGLLTRDPIAVARVENRAVNVAVGALKSYASARLGIDGWTLYVFGRSGPSRSAYPNDSQAARLHVGFSRLAPRADLLIPVSGGRVVVSADVRGRLATSFESNSSRLRFLADADVPERTATLGLSLRF